MIEINFLCSHKRREKIEELGDDIFEMCFCFSSLNSFFPHMLQDSEFEWDLTQRRMATEDWNSGSGAVSFFRAIFQLQIGFPIINCENYRLSSDADL